MVLKNVFKAYPPTEYGYGSISQTGISGELVVELHIIVISKKRITVSSWVFMVYANISKDI